MMERDSRIRRLARRHVATAAVAAAILWLTLAPHPVGDEPIRLFEGADKVVHALMFMALAGAYDAEEHILGRLTLAKGWIAAGCSAAAGALIEVAQARMDIGRSFEWADIAADSAGALAAGLLATWLASRRDGADRSRTE